MNWFSDWEENNSSITPCCWRDDPNLGFPRDKLIGQTTEAAVLFNFNEVSRAAVIMSNMNLHLHGILRDNSHIPNKTLASKSRILPIWVKLFCCEGLVQHLWPNISKITGFNVLFNIHRGDRVRRCQSWSMCNRCMHQCRSVNILPDTISNL